MAWERRIIGAVAGALLCGGLTALATAAPAAAAVLVVTRTDDPVPDGCAPGDCSLREAVIDANASPGSTIDVPAGTYTLTIPGALEDAAATGDLDVTASTTINGTGGPAVVDGGALDRVLDVHGGAVAVASLEIANGLAPALEAAGGGVLLRAGSLNMNEVVVRDNALSSDGGGSAHNEDGGGIATLDGALVITDSTITRNTALDDGGGLLVGAGTVSISDTVLSENVSVGPGDGTPANGSAAGGALFREGVTGTLTNVSFVANRADGGGATDGTGGFGNAGTVAATNLVLDSNTARAGGGGGNTPDGTLTVTGLTVTDNVATAADSGGFGNQGTLTVDGATIEGNSAGIGGGLVSTGATTFDGVTVRANAASSGAAGVAILAGTFAASDTTIEQNTTAAGAAGLYNLGATTLTDVTIADNVAAAGGGGITTAGTLTATDTTVRGNDAGGGLGGGMWAASSGVTSLTRVTLDANDATAAGGGLALLDGAVVTGTDVAITDNGGALEAGGGVFLTAGGGADPALTLDRATISGHTVSDLGAPGDGGLGAAVAVVEGAAALTNTTISGNTGEVGGAVVAVTGSVDLRFTTVAANTTTAGAAALSTLGPGSIGYRSSLVADNTGGAGPCDAGGGGAITSGGDNVVTGPGCGAPAAGDQLVAPGLLGTTLGPLAFNGGALPGMRTHKLLDGNPALDAGGDAICPAPVGDDERGRTRPRGTACDAGSYEASPPSAEPDTATTPPGTPVRIPLTGNDVDLDGTIDPTTLAVVAGPSNGSVVVGTDGSVTYTPAPGFVGTDTFRYRVCNTDGLCAEADAEVEVLGAVETPPADPGAPRTEAPSDEPSTDAPSSAPTAGTLPITGAPTRALATLGVALLVIGVALLASSRRRPAMMRLRRDSYGGD